MKNLLKAIFAMLITTLALIFTACGGGSSDSGGGGGTPAGTFTKEVALSVSTNYNVGIFGTNAFRHYQLLYKPADVAGAGYIKSIYFKRNETMLSATTCPNVTIKLAHTNVTVTDLATDMTTNIKDKGSAITVLNNATVTVPAGNAGDYFEIPLSTQFNYNGIDNLVIDFTRTVACSQVVQVTIGQGTTTYTAQVYSDDSLDPDTGTTSLNVPHTKFAFAGGDNTAISSSGSSNSYPFTTALSGQKVQQLYLASEINGSGPITGMAFPVLAVTEERTYTVNVRMGHTNLTALTDSFAGNFNVGEPVTVASAVNVVVPNGVPTGEFVWIPIPDGTFNYNGTNNLIIQIEVTAPSHNLFRLYNTVTGRRLYAAVGDNTGTVSDVLYAIKFRFYGGTVDVITDEGDDTGFIFGQTPNGRINLYRASELGTTGTITSISCRLNDNITTSATSFANFKLIIGHCPLDTLNTDPALDFVSQLTAVNSTVTVPAGFIKGDWIEIPLSMPFAYDGKSNLAVWMGTTASSGSGISFNVSRSAINATRYPGQMGEGIPGAASVTSVNYKLDTKFTISR
ncbi:MAG: hypothetical protein V1874_04910 [Spirochaetota bacterium]